ncbi:MFS transporter [Alicyclobacillus fastidiosus]|uniref:MFS transporter n=1 Tax=Alicyclobacillus fastidiosus TaxID=392011 RepID=A0ABY6ZKX6_9BACL|nr:MFS transporter [Alicyclobacillus fastidiosus]WAH43512.1 MFS transporter [Alicyclobacillus fastidiosus]GMA59674.1 MFS transporter [Alicyclobacillus fastidiosus]
MARPELGTVTNLKDSSKVRWLFIMPTLFIATLIAQIDKSSISIVMANHTFLKDMGLVNHPAIVGGLVSAFLISYGAGQLLWGPIIDRIGPRRAAMLGVTLWAITLIWGGFSYSALMLYLSRIFLGLSEGVLYPVCNAYVVRWFAIHERGRAQSIWFNGATVGSAVGGALVTSIIISLGWRPAFFILAILGLVVVLPMLLFLTKDDPTQHSRVSKHELKIIEQDSTLLVTPSDKGSTILVNYKYWLLVISLVANNIFFWGWSSWLPTYLMNTRHFSFKSAGGMTALTFALEVVVVLLLGYLTDRIRRRAPLGALGFLIAALGVYIGGSILNVPLAMGIMIIGVSCQQACAGNVQALLHSFSGKQFMGRAAGIMNGVGNIMSFLAPTIVGLMIGLNSSSFSSVMLFLSIDLLVASIALALLIKSKYWILEE